MQVLTLNPDLSAESVSGDRMVAKSSLVCLMPDVCSDAVVL